MRSSDSQKPTTALLSIKPRFAKAILDGTKRFEFRRVAFSQNVNRVVVYATLPVGKVIGEFDVPKVLAAKPRALWDATSGAAGIMRDEFFDYFRGCPVAYAILIGEVRGYRKPFCPRMRFGLHPPQSYAYIHA